MRVRRGDIYPFLRHILIYESCSMLKDHAYWF